MLYIIILLFIMYIFVRTVSWKYSYYVLHFIKTSAVSFQWDRFVLLNVSTLRAEDKKGLLQVKQRQNKLFY